MGNEPYSKELVFYFRILNVTPSELEEFDRQFKRLYAYSSSRYRGSNEDIFIVALEFNEKTDCAPLVEYLLSRPDLMKRCGIYISMVTESGHDGFSVPQFVLDLLFIIKGTLDFSFTLV